jgi:ATP-dependent DNA ligase
MICGKELLDIFDRLEDQGTNAKIQFFAQAFQQDPVVRSVMEYASHPFKMYKLTHIRNEHPSDLEHCDWNLLFQALDQLSKATGTDERDKKIMGYISGKCPFCRDLVTMILKHKLRIGMGAKNLNKCGLKIPVPGVQLCESDPSKFTSKEAFFYSPKKNGIRVSFERHGDAITFLSRKGHPFLKMHELFPSLNIPEGVLFDAEFMSARGRDHALGLAQTKLSFREPVLFLQRVTSLHLIDLPSEKSLAERLITLQKLELPQQNERLFTIPHVYMDGILEDHFERTFIHIMDEMTAQGHEGVVIKNPYLSYYPDRSNDWIKGKRFHSIDLPVLGIEVGTEGKTAGVVSKFICDFNGVEVGVGSGLSDPERMEFLIEQPEVIEVRYQSVTKDGSLEFPTFVGVRDTEK